MKNNYRYVAHFDMLGMTSAIRRNSDESWGALSDMRKIEQELDNKYEIKMPKTGVSVNNRSRSKRFSDTLILFSLSDTPEDLFSILFKSALLFCEALKICVPLRGGIAHGEFFVNPELDMFLGIALVDAHNIGESSQWLGVVVDDSIYRRRHLVPSHNNQSLIVNWELNIKDNKEIKKENRGVLNWPVMFPPSANLPVSVQEFYSPFESLFGSYSDLSKDIQSKYINTVDFMNRQLCI